MIGWARRGIGERREMLEVGKERECQVRVCEGKLKVEGR
jgi:hypothetical protein